MAEKPGRPRVLIRRHKIELPEDFDLEGVKELLVVHEAAQVARGFLSSNAGAIITAFAGVSALLAFPPTQRLATSFIAFWEQQITDLFVNILDRTIPTPEDLAEEIAEGAAKIQEAAKDAWNRITREIEQRREDGELPLDPGLRAPPFPPFFPP